MRISALAFFLFALASIPSPAQDNLAEHPNWPIGISLPGQRVPSKASILAWVPPGVKKIRAVMMTVENTDSIFFNEYPPLREVAKKHEMACVHARLSPHAKILDPDNPHSVQKILDAVAEKTSMPEFRHAPVIAFGKSSQGQFPFTTAWKYPKRTIASISYHAETPTWPMPDWVKLDGETILHVNANGESEWGGTFFIHVRPSLLNYRENTAWLVHQTVARDIGHGDYPGSKLGRIVADAPPGQVGVKDTFDYLTLFVDKALALRVPTGQYPTNQPVPLKPIDESTGYYIEPFAIEDLFGQFRQPLVRDGKLYSGAPTTTGYVAIDPADGFTPPAGVPVVKLMPSHSPSNWLMTEHLPFVMKTDPLTDLGDLATLRPKPGDAISVDDRKTTFRPVSDDNGGKGGIVLYRGGNKGSSVSFIAYTVLDVAEPVKMKVLAPFTPGGRLRVVLNGTAVDHRQTVAFKKGLYPMLAVLRLKAYHGVIWSSVEPRFEPVTDDQIQEAKVYQEARNVKDAEAAKRRAEVSAKPSIVLHPASEVKPEDRRKMFWVADQEQAEAWLKYHRIVACPAK